MLPLRDMMDWQVSDALTVSVRHRGGMQSVVPSRGKAVQSMLRLLEASKLKVETLLARATLLHESPSCTMYLDVQVGVGRSPVEVFVAVVEVALRA